MMQAATQLTLPAEVISKGVDWLTCTAKTGGSKYEMGVLASNTFRRAMDIGEKVKPQRRQGYTGFAVDGFFHGEKQGSAMAVLSGPRANDLWRAFGNVCDNVSRLDLQVTVWTFLERPHVAKVIHEQIKRGEFGMIPIKNATYIEGHPDGETININKRKSDSSARVYDKASEGRMGLSRSVWRYEVECHRRLAVSALSSLRVANNPGAAAMKMVHGYFTKRGVLPLFDPLQCPDTSELSLARHKGDTLAWFRDTLSKTVARQIELHGKREVLLSLGLIHPKKSKLVEGR